MCQPDASEQLDALESGASGQEPSSTMLFFTALARGLMGRQSFGVWYKPTLSGRWFTIPDEAVAFVEGLPSEADVYIHVGIAPPGFNKPRAKTEDLIGRLGFVADFDSPDRDAAWSIVQRAGLEPTLLVNSGHGYHAWWLFREPRIFADDDERAADADLAKGWHRTLQAHARDLGINGKLDSVFELARVMRVPGTTNNKHLDPTSEYDRAAPVELLKSDGPRYTPGEIAEALLPGSIASEQPPASVYSAAPPPSTLPDQQLIEKARAAKDGEKFTRLWGGDISGYESASHADLALCSLLAFWCGPDTPRIDRLFQQSGLGRRSKCQDRPNYRMSTIDVAIQTRTCFYAPADTRVRIDLRIVNAKVEDELKEFAALIAAGIPDDELQEVLGVSNRTMRRRWAALRDAELEEIARTLPNRRFALVPPEVLSTPALSRAIKVTLLVLASFIKKRHGRIKIFQTSLAQRRRRHHVNVGDDLREAARLGFLRASGAAPFDPSRGYRDGARTYWWPDVFPSC